MPWFRDANGQPVWVDDAAPQSGVVMPADPAKAARESREEERLRLAQEQAARSAQNEAARIDLARQAEARQQADSDAKRANNPNDQKQDARVANLRALENQIARVRELYKQGPGATSGVMGAKDYLPTPGNKQFDSAAAGLGEIGLAAFRVPGVGSQSDAELRAFIDANRPSAGDYDAQIEEKLRNLENRLNESYKALGIERGRADAPAERQIATGDNQTKDVPPAYQQAYAAFVQSGQFTPEQYASFRRNLDRQFFGDQAQDQSETYRAEGARILDDQRKGLPLNLSVPGVDQSLSGVDSLRNSAVNNPAGGFAADAFNMGGFGIPEAMAGDQYAALREEYPVASTLGQIGGAMAGTGALGRGGRFAMDAITRGAPRLGQQLARTNTFARNLATDAAYSGIYGANTGQDPLASAAMGAAGSTVGQGLAKGVGAVARGASVSPAVQQLRSAGIPLTIGQTLGGMSKSLEDKLMSVPGLGDMLRNRRVEGLQGLNRAAFQEAGAPIGYTPQNIGKEGLQELFDASGNAYDSATAGVNAKIDPKAMADLAMARAMGVRMPPNMQAGYEKVLQNYVDPVTDAGAMTGQAYQQATRALKGHKGKPPGDAFEQEWRDAITVNQDALRGVMERGGGQRTVQGLNAADASYRSAKTLEDAILDRAAGGAASGETFLATPNQLQRAGRKTQKKYPGPRPFETLADAGQEVLPSQIPDSGTAGRIAAMVAGGGLLGGGAGYATGGDMQSAAQGAALAGLLAAGGSRQAQDLGIASLTNRPEVMRRIGEEIQKRRGLIGSGSLPFFIVN